MPTLAQVINRTSPPAGRGRWYTGAVTTAGPPVVIALDPGGAETQAGPLDGATYTPGDRVLVLVTDFGNYVIGKVG